MPTRGPCFSRKRRPSRRPMKKLVVSPSTAQVQTRPISGRRSISPCPAITPPAMTTVSPGATKSDEGAGLEECEHAHERISPRPQRACDVADRRLRVRELRRQAARVDRQRRGDAEREEQAFAAQPPAAPHGDPVTSTAATAAATCPALTGRPWPSGVAITIAPSIRPAAARASSSVANSPKAVGPDPVSAAAGAPLSRNAASGSSSSGRATGRPARGRSPPRARAGARRRARNRTGSSRSLHAPSRSSSA